MNRSLLKPDDWIPAACTMPTAAQPLRRAEFDDLFSRDVLGVERTSTDEVAFTLRAEPVVAARAAELAASEAGCCSFFTFRFTITDGQIAMTVSTGAAHERVLDALAARATSLVGTPA